MNLIYAAAVSNDATGVRIDKWLWAVRLFKTRTLAATACNGGHVKLNDKNIKPARELRVGDVIRARVGRLEKIVRVKAILERRIGAKLVTDYLEDLTPAEAYEKARSDTAAEGVPHRPKGTGRPTKKQRRQLKPFTG